MKINLGKSDLAKVQNLLQTNENNIQVSDILNDYLINYPKEIDEKVLKKYDGSEIEKYRKALLYHEFELSKNDNYEIDILNKHCLNHIVNVNPNKYLNNPYYKNIKIENTKYKKWTLNYENYAAYELFPLNDFSYENEEFYLEQLKMGYMKNDFPFIAVAEDDIIWMSVIPNEIETMEENIKNATGNVVTFGLGLGYFAYMVSLKEEVKSVTIIEKNKDVINLFNKFILPQFENKEKINIINCDAFEYLLNKSNFVDKDYVYVDIHHGAEDGIFSYIKFKQYDSNYPNVKFEYWLENSLLGYIRRTMITLIGESLQNYTDSDYQSNETEYDQLINHLYFNTKNLVMNSYEDIKNLLKIETLKKLVICTEPQKLD